MTWGLKRKLGGGSVIRVPPAVRDPYPPQSIKQPIQALRGADREQFQSMWQEIKYSPNNKAKLPVLPCSVCAEADGAFMSHFHVGLADVT